MVNIKYVCRDTSFLLQAAGHAGAAPKGQDLVCCGVSVLIQTLAQRVLDLYTENLLQEFPETTLSPAGSCVAAKALPETVQLVEQAFAVILTGLRMLAEQYPQFITIFESYP